MGVAYLSFLVRRICTAVIYYFSWIFSCRGMKIINYRDPVLNFPGILLRVQSSFKFNHKIMAKINLEFTIIPNIQQYQYHQHHWIHSNTVKIIIIILYYSLPERIGFNGLPFSHFIGFSQLNFRFSWCLSR